MSISGGATRPGGDSTRDDRPDGRTDRAHFQASGFTPGAGGGGGSSSSPPPPSQPPRPNEGFDPGVVSPPPPPVEPTPVTGERPCVRWVDYEVFITRQDERVCPICGPLHGYQYEAGQGPYPPLHRHCRCQRLWVRRECVLRQGVGGSTGNARF